MEKQNIGYQVRSIPAHLEVRAADGENAPRIEGYFAVFGSTYDMGYGMSEEIDQHAFDGALSDDIRALINHDDTLVLGRTQAGTLRLRVDDHGLWGSIDVNPKDSDAMNLYARVERGDVSQCSFGFEIIEQDTEIRDGGEKIHWKIKRVKLYEVSPCTFPAYEATSIDARKKDADLCRKNAGKAWAERTLKKLKGE